MKTILPALIILGNLYSSQLISQTTAIHNVTIGGVPVLVPLPASGFVEVGDENRDLLDIFVPDQNRLVSAFLTRDDFQRMTAESEEELELASYMFLEVLIGGEYQDYSPYDFQEARLEVMNIVEGDKTEILDEVNSQLSDREEIIGKVEVGEMKILSTILDADNIYAVLMATKVSNGIEEATVICGLGLLLVNNRMLFAYVCSNYINDETLRWVSQTTEQWSRSILKVNYN